MRLLRVVLLTAPRVPGTVPSWVLHRAGSPFGWRIRGERGRWPAAGAERRRPSSDLQPNSSHRAPAQPDPYGAGADRRARVRSDHWAAASTGTDEGTRHVWRR